DAGAAVVSDESVFGLARFFFQAEDGIRDFHVTGVQTCALPISPARSSQSTSSGRCCVRTGSRGAGAGVDAQKGCSSPTASGRKRSEERRVGKSGELGGRRTNKKKSENVPQDHMRRAERPTRHRH